ncbi:MAG: hypothetical protein AB7U82_01150 [Blastocatellales bacterium]
MFKFTNVNAYNITVGSTAAAITALIDTAANDNQNIQGMNAVVLIAENGDIRFTTDGNTPTATKGLILKSGLGAKITGVKPSDVKVTRTGGSDVTVAVTVGQSEQADDIEFFLAGTISVQSGAIQTAGADGESNTVDSQRVASRGYIFNGTTWDRNRGTSAIGDGDGTNRQVVGGYGFNGSTWDRIRAGLSGVKTAITGFLNNVPYAQYLTSLPTLANNEWHHFVSTVNGFFKVSLGDAITGEDFTNQVLGVAHKPLAASTYALDTDNQMTQVTKRNSKAAAGNVFGFYVTNDNAAVRYFQIHNKASAPAATEVPVLSFKIPAGTANNPGELKIGRDILGEAGHYLSTGVSWAISTTYGTFTDSATASEHIVALKYK